VFIWINPAFCGYRDYLASPTSRRKPLYDRSNSNA
jgi:hypothetical protein